MPPKNRKSPDETIVKQREGTQCADRAKLVATRGHAVPEREQLSKVLDAIPQMVWTALPDGSIDYYNRGWYDFTGTTSEDMEERGWASVQHPDLLPGVLAQWKHSIGTGVPFEQILQLRRHDGVFRWFLARANPMRDDAGRIVRWVGIHTDIEEQKQAESAVTAANRRSETEGHQLLEDSVRARADLLAMVSHDLRNPLNTVRMAATQIERLARERGFGDRTRKSADIILKAADRMTRLVSDLLDLSTLEAGHPLPLELERHDMSDLIREAVELFDAMATARRLTLTTDVGEAQHARCDGARVQQVLSNLLGNALKFTREGGTIGLRSRAIGKEIVVSVSDTGTGISPHQLPCVFDRYWQSDPQRKRGTGLGLSIAKAIVDAHGGRIWAESTLGSGSTFHFSLPADGDPTDKEKR